MGMQLSQSFIYGMGLISMDMYEDVQKACNGSYWNATENTCLQNLQNIYADVDAVNIYDILEPCYYPENSSLRSNSRLPQSFRRLGETKGPHRLRKRQFGRAYPLRLPLRAGRVPTWPSLFHALFNSENVPCTAADIGPWELCTNNIIFYHDAGSIIPIHRELTTSGYRALIYSGDHDMCVPYTESEAWTSSLGYKVTDQWRPWFVGLQVAGYTQGYANNLTFATIKCLMNAGTDSSALTVEWGMAKLMANPGIMKQAQAEIDAVVGQDRLVQESDLPNLPFLRAVVKESFRMHPSAPLGWSRKSHQPCVVAGRNLPAETELVTAMRLEDSRYMRTEEIVSWPHLALA